MVKKEELYYDSRDGVSRIHAVKWLPEGEPVCIILLVHGMAEYINRYDEFANFLAQKGVLVAGNDHLGHGNSANRERGFYAGTLSGNTASILVFSVAALNGLTM